MRIPHPARGAQAGSQQADAPYPSVAGGRRVPAVEAGAWLDETGGPSGRCPLCSGAIEPVPDAPHFVRHRNMRRADMCVLTTTRYQPDEMTVRRVLNPAISDGNRRRFIERWSRHFLLARRIWPDMSIQRLTNMLAFADVSNLWSYETLREEDLAAVLLVLAGFMKVCRAAADEGPAGPGETERAAWVRFWFDAGVRDVGDLWMPRERTAALFRVEYREPESTPFPTGDEALRCERVMDVREAWRAQAAYPDVGITDSDREAFLRFVVQSHESASSDTTRRARQPRRRRD